MPNRPSGKGSREDDTQGGFQIQGQVSFEELGAVPSDLKVMAHVFDSQGKLLASHRSTARGNSAWASREPISLSTARSCWVLRTALPM